ncbi:hypothetical protein ACQEVI_27270 [Promicromonospora sp. CA-289599]|uniref:hypothetical protein n=1 Tax=Promicromonospora sp. CA-289599 TaxID=3240014 RepID=UPI003D89EF30
MAGCPRSLRPVPVAFAGTADDPRPQLTRVGAAYLQALGAGIDAWGTTLTYGIWDVDLAGDGDPVVGAPIKADETVDGQEPVRALNSLRDVLRTVTDSYNTNDGLGKVAWYDRTEGYVRVTKVVPPNGGEPRMVVSIPGTQPWFPWDDLGNNHPADFIGDLVGAAGGRSTYSATVALAIDEAIATDPDLDSGTPILLAGHSLGGITAADLASDPEFLADHNITDVITAGSPIDNDRIDSRIHVLEVAHAGDAVPLLDFADLRVTLQPGPDIIPGMPFHVEFSSSGHAPEDLHTKITLPNPESEVEGREVFEILADNHDHFKYGNSVSAALSSHPELAEFEERLLREGYLNPLSEDPDAETKGSQPSYEVYDVPVGRR